MPLPRGAKWFRKCLCISPRGLCDLSETQMLKSGITNIWTCFPLSRLAAFKEGKIKGQHD